MTECPVISVECENCDYRYVRSIDYTARLMCQLCANEMEYNDKVGRCDDQTDKM